MSDETPRKERRTAIKTFRLPEDLLTALEKEAEDEGTTLNALVSTILTRYSDWGSMTRKIGMISISHGVLLAALESADENKLAEAAKRIVPTGWKDMAMFKFHEFTIDSVIQLWKLITKYGWSADLDVQKDGREYLLAFRHDLGPRFSLLLANAFDETLRSSFHIQPVIEKSDASITVRFSEPLP